MTSFRKPPSRQALSSEDGFTLAEVAIALVLTSIILAMGYGAYGFAQSLVLRWQHSIRVENTAHQIARDVAQQIRAADRIEMEGSGWTVTTRHARQITYRYREDVLTREGTPMHDAGVRLRDVRVETVPFDPASPLPPETQRADGCLPSLSHDQRGSSGWRSASNAGTSNAGASSDASTLDVGRGTLYRIHLRAVTSLDSLRVCTTVAARQPETWSTSGS